MILFFSRLRGWWHGPTLGVSAAAFIVGLASLASRLLGVWRDRLLASHFGAGFELDAYYAAFRFPDLLYQLLVVGALTAGFIPVFAEYLERRGSKEAYSLAGRFFFLLGLVLVGASGLFFLLAAQVVPLVTSGFDEPTQELTIKVSRILALSPLFLGLSAVMGGVLQATKRFVAFSLAPLLYNLGIIAGIILLSPRFGVEGVAWGVVLGAAAHFLGQTLVAQRLGFCFYWNLEWRHEGVRRILKLMLPRTAGLAVTQVNSVILLSLAAALPVGSVTLFNFANNIQSLPLGLIGVSFAVAAFPELSRQASQRDELAFQATLWRTTRRILFLVLPLSALFIIFRSEIVAILLFNGKFRTPQIVGTANLLAWFALSLPAQCLIPLLARAYYAHQETWKPFWIGVITEGLMISSALLGRRWFGLAGLVMAFSVAAIIQCILLFVILFRRQRFVFISEIWKAVGLILFATAGASVITAGGHAWLIAWRSSSELWVVILRLAIGTGLFALIYGASAWFGGLEELTDFWPRFFRKKRP